MTVQSDHGKQLYEHGNPFSVTDNFWIILANIFTSQIYAAHPMVVVIHNSWNPDTNLATFSSYFVRVPIVLLVHSWSPPKTFFTPMIFFSAVTKNTSPSSIHLISNVSNESTLQKSSLKFIWVSSISLTVTQDKTLQCLQLLL